jgi:hypothetical protein
MPAAPLPRIRLLATGGTIAGAQTAGRGYRAAALSIEALVAAVPQLATLAQLEFEQVAKVLADLVGIDVDRANELDRLLGKGKARSGEADRAKSERNDAEGLSHRGRRV